MFKALIEKNSFEILNVETFFNLIIFAFLTTVISCVALVYAIKYIGSTPTAILGALEPVVAVMISVMFFQEKFTYTLFIGIILILFGVILNIISDSKNKK